MPECGTFDADPAAAGGVRADGSRAVAAAPGAGPVRTIAVASGKGGVGKTSIAVNLAIVMAQGGHNVMLMDADLGLANADVLLGLRPERNLSHVLRGECSLEEALVTGPAGIRIIPASSGVQHMAQLSHAEHAGIIHAFSELDQATDTLIVDTGAGIADNVIVFCRAVQDVVVVVCDEPTSLRDAYALIKVLARQPDAGAVHVVANMVRDAAHGRRVFDSLAQVVDRFLDVDLRFLGAVPSDRYVREAVLARRAVVELQPLSKATFAIRAIAARIGAWPASRSPNGRVQFFVERLLEASATGSYGFA